VLARGHPTFQRFPNPLFLLDAGIQVHHWAWNTSLSDGSGHPADDVRFLSHGF